ncbi:MAG: oligoendopeptidase F [Firmicutes bacterium]|nr:oligoendopeptidase F [Candidatus Caballimonas caccae]
MKAKTTNKYEWAIEDIYNTIEAWNKDYDYVASNLDFSCYKGKLNKKEGFLSCMKKQEKVLRVLEKLSVYAMMKHDSDTRSSEYDALESKVDYLSVQLSSALSFVTPELISLDEKILKGYINDKDLEEYDYSLKCILNEKKHVLTESEENLLSLGGETYGCFRDIFTKIDNADLPLKSIRNGKEKIQLSHGMYGVIMHSGNRKLREKCFKSYYGSYISLMNTISSVYAGSVKKDVFLAKARKYDSTLGSALLSEDVPEIIYHNLINSVNKALPDLHEYMRIKKKELKLKQMHMYDVYVPTVAEAELKLSYDDAYNLVVEGLGILGKDYQSLLRKAHDERWLSVYETKGKRSGAYSVAVYDTHPYVLLNYQKTTHDVFTIAHEMGHSIHSYFSNKSQPYAKADYKIFVAEVASTVNEVLLCKYLLKTAKDDKLKKYLLSYLLEMIRTTLFRQTQFSEFEEYSHSLCEKGEPLTKDNLSLKYLELNKKYYGDAVISDEEIKYEWARIPHFYRAFYVYKYSTGIISALAIAERITTEGEKAVKDYFKFLSSGNSNSPNELLKIAGVDLEKEETFTKAFDYFHSQLEEYKKL